MTNQTGRRTPIHIWTLTGQHLAQPVVVLGLAFLLGAAAGCWAAYRMGTGGAGALRQYLTGYLAVLEAGAAETDWWGLLWRSVRLPMLACLLGLCPLGFAGLPVLLAVRGFLFSFAVSACGCCAGARGILGAMLLFGLGQTVSTAALLLISAAGWENARSMALGRGRRAKYFDMKQFFVWCGVWIGISLAAAAAGRWIGSGMAEVAKKLLFL